MLYPLGFLAKGWDVLNGLQDQVTTKLKSSLGDFSIQVWITFTWCNFYSYFLPQVVVVGHLENCLKGGGRFFLRKKEGNVRQRFEVFLEMGVAFQNKKCYSYVNHSIAIVFLFEGLCNAQLQTFSPMSPLLLTFIASSGIWNLSINRVINLKITTNHSFLTFLLGELDFQQSATSQMSNFPLPWGHAYKCLDSIF